MKIAAKRKVTLTVEVKDEAGNVEGTFKATFRVPTLTPFKGNLDDTAMLDSFLESVSDLEFSYFSLIQKYFRQPLLLYMLQ